jgi:hypothetical protein
MTTEKCDGAIWHKYHDKDDNKSWVHVGCRTPTRDGECSGPHPCILEKGHSGACDYGPVTIEEGAR